MKKSRPYRLTLNNPDGRRHLVFASEGHFRGMADESREALFADIRRKPPGTVRHAPADPKVAWLYPPAKVGGPTGRAAIYAAIYDPKNLKPKTS